MIRIRKARAGDEIGISEMKKEGLKRKTWAYTGTNKFTKKHFNRLKENIISKNSTHKQFVAIETTNKKIVGSIGYDFKKIGRIRHTVHLGWGIHPDYEGKGIGTKLLKHALIDAKKRGFKRAEAEMAIKNLVLGKLL
jgi:RimJ/RimL family protein N-acetyltransferase